jgi:phosphohistidine swiveling domain-containing protein
MTERELTNFIINNRDNYEIMGSRPMSVQRSGVVGNFCRDILGVSSLVIPLPDGKDTIFIEKKAHKKYKTFVDKLLVGHNFSQHIIDYNKLGKKLLFLGRQAGKARSEKKNLLAFYSAWQRTLRAFSVYFISPFIIEDELYPRFARNKKNISLIAPISAPSILFGYQNFQLELLGNKKPINYHKLIKKYAWLKEYSLKEKLLTKRDIDDQKKEIMEKGLSLVIKNYKVSLKKNQHDYRQAIKLLKGKNKLMAEIIHEYVNIRTERIEIYQQALVGLRDFLKKFVAVVKKDFSWFSYWDAISLTPQEIILYLEQGVLPKKELLKKRVNRQTILFSPNSEKDIHNIFIYQKDWVIKIIKKYSTISSNSQEIKGVAISGGIIKGKIRLILSPKDFSKFKAGEILVTHYTSPAFMMLIKKASAIITDEGGVTSHAAIISRELKTPCVVGTKIATKVLHDGDSVEVDANKGLIKILKG